nr:MAG TPA: hypothetical protein [Caudoviricetes sp.]
MCEEHDPAERQRKIRHELRRFFEMEDAAFLCISTDFVYLNYADCTNIEHMRKIEANMLDKRRKI